MRLHCRAPGFYIFAAVGRGVEYTDMPVIRSIVRDVAKDDNRFSAIVLGVVKSPQFQMRVKSDEKASTN